LRIRYSEQQSQEALGDGTSMNRSEPVAVSGITDAVAVSAASDGFHTCALLGNGAVECWGVNSYGQLGNGETADSAMPTSVAGVANARALAASDTRTCVALGSGEVQCWGYAHSA
jgi:alpha-tubulin suppressor-like RCC1 family protein